MILTATLFVNEIFEQGLPGWRSAQPAWMPLK
jgi:hypothetical protein